MRRAIETNSALFALGIFGLVSNLVLGVFDYILVHLGVTIYLDASAAFLRIPTRELVWYYDAWPIWAKAGWTLNVWAGLAGSILLIMRDRSAVFFFAASLVGLTILTYFFSLAPFPRTAGDEIARWGEIIRNAASLTNWLHGLTVIVMLGWLWRKPALQSP